MPRDLMFFPLLMRSQKIKDGMYLKDKELNIDTLHTYTHTPTTLLSHQNSFLNIK